MDSFDERRRFLRYLYMEGQLILTVTVPLPASQSLGAGKGTENCTSTLAFVRTPFA
jgi:hypothetical protein